MNENQRPILINDPDVTLPTPRFDAEATVTAQPVVPIARRAADHASAAVGRVVSLSNRRRSLMLGMFVVSALFVGVAGGFSLALYRDRQAANAPSAANLPAPPDTAAAQSNLKDTPAAITQTTGTRGDETRNETTTDAPAVTPRSRESRAEANDVANDTNRDSSAAATTTRRKQADDAGNRTAASDNRTSRPPERTAKASAEDDRSRVKEERERRREERREEKRSRQEERASRREARAINRVGDVLSNRPRRAAQRNSAPEPRRVDRIRDIFEGRQP